MSGDDYLRRGTGPVAWLKNGRMPSLWFLARLQLGLGVLSLVGEVAAGVVALFVLPATDGRLSVWATALPAMLIFSTSIAIFFMGAGATAYLAARNDREASQFHMPAEPPAGGPPPQP